MSEEIKACPFHKNQNSVIKQGSFFGDRVGCMVCGVHLPIDSWNHRPIEDALKEKNVLLKRDIEELKDMLCDYRGRED